MSEAAQQLLPMILALPEEERAWLREAMDELPSTEPDFPPELIAELRRRSRAADDGTEPLIDGDEVLRELEEKYP